MNKTLIDRLAIVSLLAVVISVAVFDVSRETPLGLGLFAVVAIGNVAWFWSRRKQLPASQLENLRNMPRGKGQK